LSKFLKKQMSWSSCQRILTEDLRIRRVSAKFVPRLLTEEQRDNRVNVCRDLKEELRNDPNLLTKIVTGDESWCYAYDTLCALWSPITIIAGCCE
jgi:histone-lysine N-methyltransferase SETMAR